MFSDAEIVASYFEVNTFCRDLLPSCTKKMKEARERLLKYVDKSPNALPEYVEEWDISIIRECIQQFEIILQDELSKLPIFCCEDEKIGNLSSAKLLKGASNGYPTATKNHLQPACLREIDEGGRCLVLERSTAAGFHMLRSVELTIQQYLTAIPGFVMPPLNRQNWGEYLDLLKKNGAGKDVTDHLYNIKDNYRNPLMHPKDSLEMDEAVSLFAVCQSMNEMVVKDMKKRGLVT